MRGDGGDVAVEQHLVPQLGAGRASAALEVQLPRRRVRPAQDQRRVGGARPQHGVQQGEKRAGAGGEDAEEEGQTRQACWKLRAMLAVCVRLAHGLTVCGVLLGVSGSTGPRELQQRRGQQAAPDRGRQAHRRPQGLLHQVATTATTTTDTRPASQARKVLPAEHCAEQNRAAATAVRSVSPPMRGGADMT